jgi:hypothetical protein
VADAAVSVTARKGNPFECSVSRDKAFVRVIDVSHDCRVAER